MKKLTLRIILSAAPMLIGGCASLEDFRAMPPSERAAYVCERDREVSGLHAEISTTEGLISETETALIVGYRLHSFCKQVPIVNKTEEVCETTEKEKTSTKDDKEKDSKSKDKKETAPKSTTICTTKSSITRETVCEETPIVIDGRLEKERLRRYQQDVRELDALLAKTFDSCHAKVRRMTADEAFEYYQASSGLIFGR